MSTPSWDERAFSVLAAAEEAPEHPALIDEDGALTYRALAQEVRAFLPALRSLPKGARVSLTPKLQRASLVRLLAAIEAGVAVVMLHPRWSPLERARAIEHTQPSLDLDLLEPGAPPASCASQEGLAGVLALVFTSGSTGVPRAAVLSRRAFLAAVDASAEVLGWAERDRWLLAMPLAHVGGLSIVLRCLAARKTVVLHQGGIEASALQRSVARHQVTLVSLVPTMLRRWLEVDAPPSPQLRLVLVGGAACPAPLLERAVARGLRVRTTYGLTEMCGQVATLRHDARGGEGVGPALPGVEMRLREQRLWVRGPNLFDGFWGEPPPFDADGFYETGDHGSLDESGNLSVLGRRSDLIVSGGENVYPAEVEAALEGIEGIEAACVVGVSDPQWGEMVCAVWAGNSELSMESVRERLGERLADFKRPRRWVWVAALPLAPNGKVDRRSVQRMVLNAPV